MKTTKILKKKKLPISHRDAVKGEFVTPAYAKEHPTTTVAERNERRKKSAQAAAGR